MSFKRGIQPGATPSSEPPPAARIVGRPMQTIRGPIVTTPQPQTAPSRIITQAPQHEPPVRGLLVDGTGKPLRGLSRQTIEAHKAHSESATEQCQNCGKFVPPAHMKTVVANAYNSNNPLRLCNAPPTPGEPPSCAQLAYKDPYKVEARAIEPWRPSVPAVRFDRETAAPYDARARGVTMKDLVTKDTYHNEREVDSRFKTDVLIGEGNWSGGGRAGHTVTKDSVEQSRSRADRVRSGRR